MSEVDIDYRFHNHRRRQVICKAESQWWLCYYCDLPIDLNTLSRDHVVPRSEGGKGSNRNIVAACAGCNKRKDRKSAPPDGYILLKRRMYFMTLGIYSKKPRGVWKELYPGFGTDLDGERLWAPQYGIV